MKRNIFVLFIILFILSACNQQQAALQAATATQEATATSVPTRTCTPEPTLTPTPTPDPIRINAEIPKISKKIVEPIYRNPEAWFEFVKANSLQLAEGYSIVDFEDFISGKILSIEQEYIRQHAIFSGEVETNRLWPTKSFDADYRFEIKVVLFPSSSLHEYNPTARYVKLISIYDFDDQELFQEIDVNPLDNFEQGIKWMYPIPLQGTEKQNIEKALFWIFTWAYQDSSGDVKLIHTLVDNLSSYVIDHNRVYFNLNPECRYGSDLRPRIEYSFIFKKIDDDEVRSRNDLILDFIYSAYPEVKPDEDLVLDWVKTGDLPDELESKLFQLSWYHDCWRY